ncbi:hypothetical protein D3C71_1842540 [compost metagenome]
MFAGLVKGIVRAVADGQTVGDRGLPPFDFHLALHAQLVADAADRTLRVDPFLVRGLAEIGDLGMGEARQRRQVVAVGQVGGLRGCGQQQTGKESEAHAHPYRILMD